ncbi:hypothetical protein CEB3_c21190 [Peptococcaceae bacterium CEB3]|nr:hypothetical protein CEB3_c21190 [Peptococcaceae bacterium CEB3]
MYREIHELPYQSGLKEIFFSLGPLAFSLGEFAWIAAGVIVSYKMTQIVPPIPLLPFPLKYLHYPIPLLVAYFFAKASHPATGVPLWKYILRWVAVRRRQRVFYYRKINTAKGGDRHI